MNSFKKAPSLGLLGLLVLALWGGEALRRDLWEPDEARYAYVAREMAQDGHLLVPHRSGEYYAHKPPLLFWMIRLGSIATGLPIGRVTVRIPGLLAGWLALWATARLAARWAGERAAWPAVLTLCTTYLFWHEIGFSRMDGPLLCWTLAAMTLWFLNDDSPSIWRPALAWLLTGLAILTKGPVGLLIPAGAYATARLMAGEGRVLRKSHWIWGPILGLSLPALWLALVWVRGAPEGYFRELLFSQNVERVAGVLGHQKPWYYFFGTLPVDLLPWTLCLPAATQICFRDPERKLLLRRVGGWCLFIFVFFSLSASKRNIYILGLFPPVAILIGATWSDLADARFRWARVARGVFQVLLPLTALALGLAGLYPKLPIPARALWPSAAVAAIGSILLWRESRKSSPARFFGFAALSWLALQASIGLFVYPAVNPLKTPVELARATPAFIAPGRPLLIYRVNGEIFAFYANRPGKVLNTPAELLEAMKTERRGLAVFKKSDYETWPFDTHPLTGNAREFRMGGKKMIWLEFDL